MTQAQKAKPWMPQTRWQRFCRWVVVKIWYEDHCWGIDPWDAYDKEQEENHRKAARRKRKEKAK